MSSPQPVPIGARRSPGHQSDVDRRADDQPVELAATRPFRRLAAEFLGTFLLTFVAAGGEIMARKAPLDVSSGAKAVAPGLIVLAMIYAVSDVSGAHFNPAVTLGFALRGDFGWRFVVPYWATQLCASAAATGVLRAMFSDVADLGASSPKMGVGLSLGIEILLTAALVTVILGTATRSGIVGPQAAIPVGATIAVAGLIFGPVSGASMNPARSFGPAVVSGHVSHLWLYVLGPAAGAAAAVLTTWLVHGGRDDDERRAAEGEASS